MSNGTSASLRVLVYGGRGALGSIVVSRFVKSTAWTLSVDMAANDEASENCIISAGSDTTTWMEQSEALVNAVSSKLHDHKLDAIFCVAGGWAGGNAESKDFIKNADVTWRQSVWSSAIAAELAAKFLKPNGVLVLTGAQPALKGTPGMIGYGMAKAAVHQLTESLAAENSGMPSGSTALAILPVTLDTPMNRKWMPKADTSTWTPLEFVADLFASWTSEPAKRPKSGSLLQLLTKDGHTDVVSAHHC